MLFSLVGVVALSACGSSPPPAHPAAAAIPSTSASFNHDASPYQSVNNEVLFETTAEGEPVISGDLTNIHQGHVGDCYFLASLLAIANRDPSLIEHLVTDNGNGTYSATFHALENYTTGTFSATVNGELPANRRGIRNNGVEQIGGHSIAWGAIIEKLWAAVNRGYPNIDGTDASNTTDHDIQYALWALTGISPTVRDPGTSPMNQISLPQMVSDFNSGVIVIGTSDADGAIESDHSLAVLGVDPTTGMVTLGNPQGGTQAISFSTFEHTDANQYLYVPLPK